jgi:hypothetical protein
MQNGWQSAGPPPRARGVGRGSEAWSNRRTMLIRLGFSDCASRDFGITFADDLRERAVVIHASPPKNGRPPNAGTSTARVFDLCPDDTKAVVLESGSEFGRAHLRHSNRFVEARHRASLSPPGGYRRAAKKRALINVYPGVEPTPHEPRRKFDGSEQGACRCHHPHFRRPRADFSVWTDWNGPQLSWALCLSDWRLGWCSSDGLPYHWPPRRTSRSDAFEVPAGTIVRSCG